MFVDSIFLVGMLCNKSSFVRSALIFGQNVSGSKCYDLINAWDIFLSDNFVLPTCAEAKDCFCSDAFIFSSSRW